MAHDVYLRLSEHASLAPALAVVARNLGVPVRWRDGGDTAVLVGRSREKDLTMRDADALHRCVLMSAVRSVLRGIEPCPSLAECVVLAPAAGICGRSDRGPVDAVVDTALITESCVLDAARVSVTIREMTVQHTRCWVLVGAFTGTGAASLRWRPHRHILTLPEGVCTDTAAATQYMHDAGHHAIWPQIAVMDPVQISADGTVRLVALFTEATYLGARLANALDELQRDRGQ